MLIIFNEVNMELVMMMCKNYKDMFEKVYGYCFGFMFFFVRVVVEVLKKYFLVNVFIDGMDIVYYGYYDVGVVVLIDCGFVVFILCDVDKMNFVEIEGKVVDYGKKV